ncbi:MAG: tol-pal system-associated acyl-CoA thioesterase [Pseudomonadota bacterium]
MSEPIPQPLREFSMPARVYIEDTDAGGIVYYVNYLKFMERARTEWLRALGFQHYTLQHEDFLFVVHRAEVDYRRPAQIDDELRVTAVVEKAGRASLHFRQQVIRARDGEVLAMARIEVASVSRQLLTPRAMPKGVHDAVRAWLAGDR